MCEVMMATTAAMSSNCNSLPPSAFAAFASSHCSVAVLVAVLVPVIVVPVTVVRLTVDVAMVTKVVVAVV